MELDVKELLKNALYGIEKKIEYYLGYIDELDYDISSNKLNGIVDEDTVEDRDSLYKELLDCEKLKLIYMEELYNYIEKG